MSYLCKNCDKQCMDILCKPCKIDYLEKNFESWTSGNKEIDNFIQEIQEMQIIGMNTVFKWIPYNQFSDIKKIGRGYSAEYSAIWKDSPLYYYHNDDDDEKVVLRCLYNLQDFTSEYLKESNQWCKIYGISQNQDTEDYILVLQNVHCVKCGEQYANKENKYYEWCRLCSISNSNRISGNEKIDNFIQEIQLKINGPGDVVFEWIPYNQFINIEKMGKSCKCIAIWKDGPLVYYCNDDCDDSDDNNGDDDNYDDDVKNKYIRIKNEKVVLRRLYNSQDLIIEYYKESNRLCKVYGISQNPDTNDYILVLKNVHCIKCGEQYTNVKNVNKKWCKPCLINDLNRTSGNEKIDDFIQMMQSGIDSCNYVAFEWIPYNQFDDIKQIGKDHNAKYLAVWKDGPLYHDKNKYTRSQNEKVALICLYNIDEFLNEVKRCSNKNYNDNKIYGISQNPNTKGYILVLKDIYCIQCGVQYTCTYINRKWCKPCYLEKNFTSWTSGNEKVDNFIQIIQELRIFSTDGMVFGWIPYNQFDNIKKLGKDYNVKYSAIWKDGLLYYHYNNNDNFDGNKNKCVIIQNEKVVLKCLYNSQDFTDEYLKEENYWCKTYGISQNPDTKDYILVLKNVHCVKCGEQYTNIDNKWCKPCLINDSNRNSGNEKVDNIVQEMQLKIDGPGDVIFEWIPYSQFNGIKEITKVLYSAIWKDGPLYGDDDKYGEIDNDGDDEDLIGGGDNYRDDDDNGGGDKHIRIRNKEVALKWCNVDKFLSEVESYSVNKYSKNKIYGISQNPDTKDYFMVLQNTYCKKCGEEYTIYNDKKWCQPCLINNSNRISGNEKINNFIQEIQSKISGPNNIVFEWVPYNQFIDVKEIDEDSFAKMYSATWKDGPLNYDESKNEYTRNQNKKVSLKYLYNSQDVSDEFLNEVKELFSVKKYDYGYYHNRVYGISQHSVSKNCIVVLENICCEKCDRKYTNEIDKWCKPCQIDDLKENFTSWTSGNEDIDNLIQEIQLKVDSFNDIIFEWISYGQFDDIEEIGEGGFAKVYSATWKDGPLNYDKNKMKYTRNKKKVALKCLFDTQNITNEFLNEVKAYSIQHYYIDGILNIHGMSQDPNTNNYVMVLDYAIGGNFNHWMSKNYLNFSWEDKLTSLWNIIKSLGGIHQKQMIHNDLHTGNILINIESIDAYRFNIITDDCVYISDMGQCGKVGNTNPNDVYGVVPYLAPEVLRRKPYTQAADIYSFGMIMYFVVTGKQPFSDYAHDRLLVSDICNNEVRPEINEPEAPKCYIDLMKRCWNSNPDNRPKATEIVEMISLFIRSYLRDESSFKYYMKTEKENRHYEIEDQFKQAEKYRNSFVKSKQSTFKKNVTHTGAIYTSRLLNSFTENIQECDDDDGNTLISDEFLDCEI